MQLHRLALPMLLLCVASPSHAELFAVRLTPQNLAQRRVGGPDAIAGVGDWAIGNGTLCAALADAPHETVLSPGGGILVDVGHCGRNDDRFIQLQPLFNLSRANIPPTSEIRAEVTDRESRIVTTGERLGLRFDTRYTLDRDEPHRLRIVSTMRRVADGPGLFLFGDVTLHGTATLQPFTANTGDPRRSIGFDHPPVDNESIVTMVRGIQAADLQVLVAGSSAEPGIAYGLVQGESRLHPLHGAPRTLPSIGLNGPNFTILGVFANPLRVGGPDVGLLELAQLPLMDLEVGETLTYERHLWLGDRSDVASITNQLWRSEPLLSGRVDDPSARIRVTRDDGAPFTEVKPEPDGRYAVHLPAGRYTLRAYTPDGREAERSILVGEHPREVPAHVLGTPARIALPFIAPARLVFHGVGDTPDPLFGDDGIDLRFGGVPHLDSPESNQLFLAGLPDDPREVVVRPGRYRVVAAHGPEFDVTQTEIEVAPGARTRLELARPERVLSTPGWLSADLHVHAGPSDDSSFPLTRRLASYLAEGADVIVATDHDRVTDYSPLIRELGVAGRIASVVGSEITSTVIGGEVPYTAGHYNALFLRRDPGAYRDGTPRHEGRRLRRVIADLRTEQPLALVQLNHPRGVNPGAGEFLTHLSVGREFDPTVPLARLPNRSLVEPGPNGVRDVDFHAMELLNGSDLRPYARLRADWFSLLLQGEIRTATANSDSHSAYSIVALPRNYVRVSGDRAATFDPAELRNAILHGHSCGTTGPLLDVSLDGAGPGQHRSTSRGELQIGVRTAPWVPVSTIRVFVNAERVAEVPFTAGETLGVPLTFRRDAFVFVEVEGAADDLYADAAPGFTPFAFCNPIFVDADGDGAWTPPGLPVLLPAAVSRPEALR